MAVSIAIPLLKIIVERDSGQEGTRTLLVPTVADRVLQTVAARYLSQVVRRGVPRMQLCVPTGALGPRQCIHPQVPLRYVADADITTFFDEVDHTLLLAGLAERVRGSTLPGLLRQWIRGSIWDGKRITRLHRGIPQGSPISPLLGCEKCMLYLSDPIGPILGRVRRRLAPMRRGLKHDQAKRAVAELLVRRLALLRRA